MLLTFLTSIKRPIAIGESLLKPQNQTLTLSHNDILNFFLAKEVIYIYIYKDRTSSDQHCSVSSLVLICYCMVCVSVREDNLRALASGLSPVHMQNLTTTCLLQQLHQHAFVFCELRDILASNIGISMKGALINEACIDGTK